jgi:hypothetical protein
VSFEGKNLKGENVKEKDGKEKLKSKLKLKMQDEG